MATCNPQNGSCPGFTSTSLAYGVWTNATESLATTQECTFTVDATQAVARVVFSDTANLGIVSYSTYSYGDVITVAAGKVQTFTLYNADPSGGSVSFTLSYTMARELVVNSLFVMTGVVFSAMF